MNSKVCVTCGRSFEWRKKWEKNWNQVKYCSDQCRKVSKKQSPDLLYSSRILELLLSRKRGVSICPSEVLALLDRSHKELMEQVRQAARILAHKGVIEITQKNQVVNPDSFKGPIRLRLK